MELLQLVCATLIYTSCFSTMQILAKGIKNVKKDNKLLNKTKEFIKSKLKNKNEKLFDLTTLYPVVISKQVLRTTKNTNQVDHFNKTAMKRVVVPRRLRSSTIKTKNDYQNSMIATTVRTAKVITILIDHETKCNNTVINGTEYRCVANHDPHNELSSLASSIVGLGFLPGILLLFICCRYIPVLFSRCENMMDT